MESRADVIRNLSLSLSLYLSLSFSLARDLIASFLIATSDIVPSKQSRRLMRIDWDVGFMASIADF